MSCSGRTRIGMGAVQWAKAARRISERWWVLLPRDGSAGLTALGARDDSWIARLSAQPGNQRARGRILVEIPAHALVDRFRETLLMTSASQARLFGRIGNE